MQCRKTSIMGKLQPRLFSKNISFLKYTYTLNSLPANQTVKVNNPKPWTRRGPCSHRPHPTHDWIMPPASSLVELTRDKQPRRPATTQLMHPPMQSYIPCTYIHVCMYLSTFPKKVNKIKKKKKERTTCNTDTYSRTAGVNPISPQAGDMYP